MPVAAVRNIAVIAGIAAVIAFVPEADGSADVATVVLDLALTGVTLFIAIRLYQMFRIEIYGLGDRWRGVLYVSLGLIVLAMAGRTTMLDTTAGTLAWIAMMAAAGAGLYGAWRQHKAYLI